jgi:hypothetical protein
VTKASLMKSCGAVFAGLIGLAIGLLSAAAGRAMVPAWYLLAIVMLSLPATWIGAASVFRRGRFFNPALQ